MLFDNAQGGVRRGVEDHCPRATDRTCGPMAREQGAAVAALQRHPFGHRIVTSASSNATPAADELAVLSALVFDLYDAPAVLSKGAAAVSRIGPCQTEMTYLHADDAWHRSPADPDPFPEIDQLVRDCGGSGAVAMPGRRWCWAFLLKHRNVIEGTLVVSAANQPSSEHVHMLMMLANQIAAALAWAAAHRRDERCTEQLARTTTELAEARHRLRTRTRVHETIEAALGGGEGEPAITDALHELTALPIVLEDRFGNLRCWSGPNQPTPYPKPGAQQRQRQLAALVAHHGPMRIKDRVAVLITPRGENLGVLAIIDPNNMVTDDDIFALHFACTLLGYELSHRRNLVELEQSVRRELFDDLLAGTDDEGAVARAEALGHDLRRPQYVVVVHSSVRTDALAAAAVRATAALDLDAFHGLKGGLVVLLTSGRPDPRALHRALNELLGTTCAIGIGSRCDTPSEVPQSFTEARRALNVRLHSAAPAGASAYDELGFYRLIDAAHAHAAVDDFIREWLGALLEYDTAKKSELVATLSAHLENGGNYDDSAKALHIHRSTLRYRLARIGELTGYDLRNVDTRFNLHAATRAWRFLHSDSVNLTGSS